MANLETRIARLEAGQEPTHGRPFADWSDEDIDAELQRVASGKLPSARAMDHLHAIGFLARAQPPRRTPALYSDDELIAIAFGEASHAR